MQQKLSLETVGDLDGGSLRVEFNKTLGLIVRDLDQRPALAKPRRLTLEIIISPEFRPNLSGQPELTSAGIAWQIKAAIPAHGAAATTAKAKADGTLAFQSDLPEAPDGLSIMDEAERRRRERENKA